jgi:8-oxo-dGTP pyrophosphatase MutT (NUDIX family)
MHTDSFLALLSAHKCADRDEEKYRADIMQFVSAHPHDWWSRANATGHVTGSVWIVNAQFTHALLLHHAKLNMWVQPGGHLDETDDSPAAGALREAHEETGINELTLASTALFDVDIHAIPARTSKLSTEPAHFHYDVRYLIVTADERTAISTESLDVKWMALQTLAEPVQERSIARMAEKSLRLKP